jgi:ADP-heptose:LPS heptosyltransferase
VIEIGITVSDGKVLLENYIDLRGRTSLEELVAVIAAGTFLSFGPVSGAVHIAAAAGIPAVAINGGFERPQKHFTGNI